MVSIIMPAFNAGRYIRDAIQSVIDQAHTGWELLVIDDGSTDNTREIVKTFADVRIRYFHQANQGVSAARNVGLAHMRGSFLCFLDADDVLAPASLVSRLSLFANDVRFVDGGVEIYDEKLQTLLSRWEPSQQGHVLRSLIRLSAKCFFGLTWMIKVEPGFPYRFDTDIRHGEDLLFFITIAHLGSYSYTPEIVLKNRRRAGSAMSNLVGLAQGYVGLRRKVKERFAKRVPFVDFVFLNLKVRKIMFLSFSAAGQFRNAFVFLLTGNVPPAP